MADEEQEEPEARDYGEQTNADKYVGVSPEYATAAYDTDAPTDRPFNSVEKRVVEYLENCEGEFPTGLGPAVGVEPIPEAGEEEDDGGETLTKQALTRKAAALGIEGRSTMSKDELAEAVADAEDERNADVAVSKQKI